MKRVAITINTSWNIYNFRLGLIKELQSQGYEVLAIAPEDDFSKLLIKEGCIFVPLKMENKGSNPLKDLGLIFQLYKIYKAFKPSIVLQFTIKPNIYGSIAAKWAGVPVINNVSGLGTVFLHENFVSKIAKTLYKKAFKSPKKIFFQNPDDLKSFLEEGLVKESITGILPGSGVDITKFQPQEKLKSSTFTFLLIARVLKDKGINEYAEAIRIVKEIQPDTHFQLMGAQDPGPLGIPEEQLKVWQKEGLFEYIPFASDTRPHIANADCIVLPSYREGTPKTLLEAAAMAKPLIATDVPGCKEVVLPYETGLLCKVKNANSLARALNEMMLLPEHKRRALGENARKLVVLKYDEKIVIRQYLEEVTRFAN